MLHEFFQSKLDGNTLEPVIKGLFFLDPTYSTVKMIMESCTVQSLQRKDRFLLLELIFKLTKNSKIQDPAFDSLLSTSFEGERDPECLILCFKIIRLAIDTCSVPKQFDELLKFALAYYPITFSHQEELKNDLKSCLRTVLASLPVFAGQVLPVLNDKFKSASVSVRMDVMQTILSCLDVYDSEIVEPFIKIWWPLLKKEVATSPENKLTALKLAQKLGRKSTTKTLLNLMTSDLIDCLGSKDLADSNELGKIMISIGTVSGEYFDQLTEKIVEQMLKRCTDELSNVQQSSVGMLLDFLVAMNLVYAKTKIAPVAKFIPHIISILCSKLEIDNETTPIAIRALGELLKSDLVDQVDLSTLAEKLVNISVENEKYNRECSICYSGIAKSNPITAKEFLLPILDRFVAKGKEYATLFYLDLSEGIFHECVSQMFACIISGSATLRLVEVLARCFKKADSSTISGEFELIFKLFQCEELNNQNLLSIIALIMRHGSLAYIFLNSQHQQLANQLECWDLVSSSHVNYLSIILGYINPSVEIRREWVSNLAFDIFKMVNDEHSANCAGIVIGSLLNKNLIGYDFLDSLQKADSISESFRQHQLILSSWVAKGLVIRNDVKGYQISQLLIEQMGPLTPNHLSLIVRQNEFGLFTKLSHCTQRLLYKQKFYTYCLPQLTEKFHKSADANVREYILTTIATIVENDQKISYFVDFKPVLIINKLIPLLIMALNSEIAVLLESSVKALMGVMHENHLLLIDNMETVIQRLLKLLSREKNDHAVKLALARIMGVLYVKCYDVCNLSSYRKKVFKGLAVLTYDNKRVVRAEAAKSRLLWHLQT